jgi:AraC-like DNA-binding protein
MNEAAKLPSSLFTTSPLRARDQFDAWHESIKVIFDVDPLEGYTPDRGFAASVRAFHLGSLLVSQVDFEGQHFLRGKHRSAVDGLDHYLVQLYAEGGQVGTADDDELRMLGGDVQILDLTQSNVTQAEASRTIAVVVPRDALDQALPKAAGALHGLILRGDRGAGGLLADYMRSLVTRADTMTVDDASSVAQVTTDMIAACARPTVETMMRARIALDTTMLERIQHHIAANLHSPGLHPEALSGLFRISRSRLYRLFEPLGGVASYIQEQRLLRAHAALSDPTQQHRRIYDIAFALGFSSEAHFSRLFRSTFGLSPSDVRARAHEILSGKSRPDGSGAAGGGYEEWLRNFGKR